MKRIFSEVQKEKMLKSRMELLKQDLRDGEILLKNKSYRSAYIFLFDSLERVFDLFFITKGEKPSTRREREESVFKYFSPETYRKFRNFYYERRGGMYDDFSLITGRDFRELFEFFKKVLSEVKTKIRGEIDAEISKIVEEIDGFKLSNPQPK